MKKQNIEAWERIRVLNDNEIRSFVAAEKGRLGVLLQGFEVTWAATETECLLEVYSKGSQTIVAIDNHPWPWGKGIALGRISQQTDGNDTLEQIQQAGRAFYYLWRKEIDNLTRNLGA